MNNGKITHICLMIIMGLSTTISNGYTHKFINKTPYPVELFVGYQSAFCGNIGHRLIYPGETSVENAGACAIDSVQGYWPNKEDHLRQYANRHWTKERLAQYTGQWWPNAGLNSNKLGSFVGDATYTFTEHTNPLNQQKALILTQTESKGLGSIVQGGLETGIRETGSFFENTVYKQGLRDTIYEKGIKPGAEGVVDAAKVTGEWLGDRFKNTKTTRAVDYGIRKAALESALAVATGALTAAKGVAQGTLIASRETANQALIASQRVLDGIKQASSGVLVGAAEASKGILEGVKQGTKWTLEGGKLLLKEGPLNWLDLNEIRYNANYKELKNGILGNVVIKGELFKQQLTLATSIDPKNSLESLINNSFKPIINSIAEQMVDKVLSPLKDAVNSVGSALSPAKATIKDVQQASPEIKNIIDLALQNAQAAQTQVTQIKTENSKAQTAITATLTEAQDKAAIAMEEEVKKTL